MGDDDIAIEIEDKHPDVDVVNLRFTDLHKWVRALAGFYPGSIGLSY
ncbi:MAG: Fe-S cluster assembly protein IscX [Nitrospinae bacterium]|nr:Fe-S cluster assembly protein IscX [Nitrospinota bacterium]